MNRALSGCTVVAPLTMDFRADFASKPVAPNAYMLAITEWYGSPVMTPSKSLFCDHGSHTSLAWWAWLNMDWAISPDSCGASRASNCTWERYMSQPEKLAYWSCPLAAWWIRPSNPM